ncbi:hypothetical protein GCM10023322_69480 [Rugosimonospora acidiphila]|uniref:Uncharacterized protein n=1 Tax=Rugosimonospora acidiphila TaxID=556531 RepID=A0ABP9SN65_9ACTN
MKKALVGSGLAGLALAVGSAVPAMAADTATTLTVTSAGLSISVPGTANIGTGGPGTTISGQLGTVTVTDARALLNASWNASVISTDFTTGTASPAETIPNINVLYWSGPATATAGPGTFTPGQPAAADAVIINVPRTAFSLTGGTGNNAASWNPTLQVNVPNGTVGGIYTGTVTHSVF